MQNYSVEEDSDIDFFAAIKELQQQQPSQALETDNSNDSNDPVCLITNAPLNAFHVELACGHKFNYESLYQEVLRQKGRIGMHNYFEKICMHQVKCPYCRSITNQLLPYIGTSPHPVIKRLVGVNAPAYMCMPGTPCGANKCHANAFYEHNQKLYCYRHHKIAIKPKSTAAKSTTSNATNASRCVAENQTGKNKGKQCRLKASQGSTLCKTHAKCNMVMMANGVIWI